jgi:uncharacterized protein with HEPN domain
MITKHAKPYLLLIDQSLVQIATYTPDAIESFLEDQMCQDAVAMRLQEIGENLARIRDATPDYFAEHSDDTWNKIIGLRNLISHGYNIIDQEQIWEIIKKHLPGFAQRIKNLLQETSN